MIEFTETAIFQKNAILDIISDIDVFVSPRDLIGRYLTRIHDNCDAISAERSKEEYIFKQKREEVTHVIDELDHQKQLLWEESQSLLGHVQKSRQEIERITAVVGERKQEKEELDTMLRLMPKVGAKRGGEK
jgi:singapore isolate B (sub-type 7) whole genome shotgun sequence assembly, scaffold_10